MSQISTCHHGCMYERRFFDEVHANWLGLLGPQIADSSSKESANNDEAPESVVPTTHSSVVNSSTDLRFAGPRAYVDWSLPVPIVYDYVKACRGVGDDFWTHAFLTLKGIPFTDLAVEREGSTLRALLADIFGLTVGNGGRHINTGDGSDFAPNFGTFNWMDCSRIFKGF